MSLFDIIILIILAFFFFRGLGRGLIRVVGGLVGLIVGAILAGKYAGIFGHSFTLIAFFVIFILANRLTAFIFYLVGKIFNIIAIIPGLKSINRLAGGILGLLEGAIILGVLIYVASRFPFFGLDQYLAKSQFAELLSLLGNLFLPLFKELF